jgi:serine/threonine-protein kinase PknG
MEYVGGRSLKEIVLARRRQGESLPLPLVLAYGLEILHAFGYLHSHGLLYCDLKPDNVLQTEEQLKIIDLGGVISADDDDSPVYGTVGYQAPEVAERGPSPSSDLYTVGRTLAVLSFEFTGYTRRYRNRLPDRDQIPLLAEHESFDRLLRRATDADPDRRFRTAEDMAVQLTGVLREVLSVREGRPRPAPSTLFGSETRAYGTRPAATPTARPARVAMATALPIPLADPADPAARLLSGLAASGPAQVFAALSNATVRSIEVELRLIRAKIELGRTEAALNHLARISQDDWRVGWYRGLANLAAGGFGHARDFFDATFSLLPGEPAPKLALAFCAQARRELEQAGRYFELVWNTDHSFISAAFGLAAVRGAQQDHARSVEVLESIPDTSIHYVDAQQAAITARLRAVRLTFAELSTAAERMLALGLDGEPGLRLTADVLETALEWLGRWQTRPADRLVGVDFTESGLRLELERTYRSLAQLTPHRAQRIELIDRANTTRPRTRI